MAYYYYYIASLPVLTFGEAPPFSINAFVEKSRDWISRKDFEILSAVADQRDAGVAHPAYITWQQWEDALRNGLVAVRAGRLDRDPAECLRGNALPSPAVRDALAEIVKSDNPMTAERRLDQLRWQFIDELAALHYFDLQHLLTYLLKLVILHRWASLNEEAGEKVLNDLSTIDGTMETQLNE